jgi:hypothetical protein
MYLENINKLEINYQLSWSAQSSQIVPLSLVNTHQQQTFGYTPVSIKRKYRMKTPTWAFVSLLKLYFILALKNSFSCSPLMSTRHCLFRLFIYLFILLCCSSCLSNISVCPYATEMIKWVICPPLAHRGIWECTTNVSRVCCQDLSNV